MVIRSGFSLSFVVDAEPAAQWAGAAATWTPSFMFLPALSRAEPENGGVHFLFLGLLSFRFKRNRHLDLQKRFLVNVLPLRGRLTVVPRSLTYQSHSRNTCHPLPSTSREWGPQPHSLSPVVNGTR